MSFAAGHVPDRPSRLVSHFQGRAVDDHGTGWSDLWDNNESNLWDRGRPSPALIDLIEQRPDIFNSHAADECRKKALVPGCGRGYDVVMLSLHGFDAYGLEISSIAVAAAEAYAATELRQPTAHNFGSGKEVPMDHGSVMFLQGDFFQHEWESKIPGEVGAKFDLIYDYTFLCAIHPRLRTHWAARMGDLLSSGGILACLEFPLYKDPGLPGPPWGVQGVYWDLLVRGGDGLVERVSTLEDSHDSDQNTGLFERILRVRPHRTYEIGKGTDMLSVYVRK